MISAKLIKSLEKEGFELAFPNYDSNENRIIDILKENNERLFLAIPLLLQYDFSYDYIIKELKKIKNSKLLIKQFNKTIISSQKIFSLENISNKQIKKIIKENKIDEKISKEEFNYYFDAFQNSTKNKERNAEELFQEQIKIRGKLNTNKALSTIFSPAKIRIMDKIFNHELLTNTELKYYYRSIRPLINSILNENLQKYIRLVESSKKYN